MGWTCRVARHVVVVVVVVVVVAAAVAVAAAPIGSSRRVGVDANHHLRL